MSEKIIAYVDKTVVKLTGLKIQGLKPFKLEEFLSSKIGRPVRVIGVTSDSLQMDIYGLEPEAVLEDKEGFIKAISLVPGITASEVVQIEKAEKAVTVPVEELARNRSSACPKERWIKNNE